MAVARHAEAWIETSPKYIGSRLQVGRLPGRVDVTGPVSRNNSRAPFFGAWWFVGVIFIFRSARLVFALILDRALLLTVCFVGWDLLWWAVCVVRRHVGCGGASASNRSRIRLWRGHEAGSVMMIRVFFSTMVRRAKRRGHGSDLTPSTATKEFATERTAWNREDTPTESDGPLAYHRPCR